MSKPPAAGKEPACPVCAKPAAPGYAPFCGRRCADIDLGRWFGEAYRVPAEEVEELPSDDDLPG